MYIALQTANISVNNKYTSNSPKNAIPTVTALI